MAAIACLALSACDAHGDGVQRVAPSKVPLGLLSPDGDAGGTPTAARGPVVVAYLLDDERLVAVRRRATGANAPADAIRSLLSGPTAGDSRRGYVSAIPAETHLLSLDVADRTATIDLNRRFGTVSGDQQILAVAQIVYTVTAASQIDNVRFSIDGDVVDVPDGSGSLASTPRTKRDYAQLAPR